MELVIREAFPYLPTPKYEKTVHIPTFTVRADVVHRALAIGYAVTGLWPASR